MSPLLSLAAVQMEGSEGNHELQPNGKTKDPDLLDKIMSVKDLLFSLEKLEMDLVEYALFKTIILFNPGNLVSRQFNLILVYLQFTGGSV